MSRPPRYAPKNQYRTRQSAGEVDAIDDNSATTIDRMVPDFEELERQYGPRRDAERAARAPAAGSNKNLVLVLAVALGVAVFAFAALGVFVLVRLGG